MLTPAAGSWFSIGLPVVRPRIWRSVPAALAIFNVGVTAYVASARRHARRHRRTDA